MTKFGINILFSLSFISLSKTCTKFQAINMTNCMIYNMKIVFDLTSRGGQHDGKYLL